MTAPAQPGTMARPILNSRRQCGRARSARGRRVESVGSSPLGMIEARDMPGALCNVTEHLPALPRIALVLQNKGRSGNKANAQDRATFEPDDPNPCKCCPRYFGLW